MEEVVETSVTVKNSPIQDYDHMFIKYTIKCS